VQAAVWLSLLSIESMLSHVLTCAGAKQAR